MKKTIYILAAILLLATPAKMVAQSKTQYFQPSYAQRHHLNPAFAPQSSYFSLGLGKTDIMLRSNIGLSNFMYPLSNGELGTFMHPEVSADQFLSQLSKKNYAVAEVDVSLLSVGWFHNQSFWTIDFDFDVDMGMMLPYDLFNFLKTGMDSNYKNYNMEHLGINAHAYATASLGYSRPIGEGWRVGGKLKFVTSLLAAELDISQLNLQMSDKAWSVDAIGTATVMGNVLQLIQNSDGIMEGFMFDTENLKPAGYGAAIDLGAEYAFKGVVEGLRLSMAVTDLGFVRYNSDNISIAQAEGNINYEGFNNIDSEEDIQSVIDQLENELLDMTQLRVVDPTNITRMLNATLNVGAEYAFCNNKLSAALLSSTTFSHFITIAELTAIFNMRPAKWFSANVSYSFANTHNAIGTSLNLTPPWGINLFLACDYISLKTNPQFIPLKDAHFNFQVGITVPFGYRAEQLEKKKNKTTNNSKPSIKFE